MSFSKSLTLSHTILTFNKSDRNAVLKYCLNIVVKGENAGKYHSPLFSTTFPIISKTINFILSTFKLLSANNAFRLHQFKILSFFVKDKVIYV